MKSKSTRLWTKRWAVSSLLAVAVATATFAQALAGAVGTAAGFEDDDGNLIVNSTFDWNGFSPTTWTGAAPGRTSTKTVSGFVFNGLEDAQGTTSDTAFAGGEKQDHDCASVSTAKASNKDDLQRIYIAHKTGADGHIYLELAWVRIPQNTTSPSAHVAFEFNQGTTACGAGSDGLVHRSTANGGDMLIVYDFEGGTTDNPSIKLGRWIASGTCEVGSDAPPCWSTFKDLTASGFAEAKVNTTVTALDTIAPSNETLQLNEFGETGIDLTGAGVFSANACTGFGKAFGVSRSSGNSGTAQMKDLVGPGNVNISNCGQVIIRKVTSPSPDPTNTTFGYTTTGGLNPSTFNLKDGQSQDYGKTVFAGSYSVAESNPSPTFALTNIDCSASSTVNGTTITPDIATRTASFALKADDIVDCTYTNTLQLGAIKITKSSTKGSLPLAGATFEIKDSNNKVVSTPTSDVSGIACADNLAFGAYSVRETAAPLGYSIEDATTHIVNVDANATCSSGSGQVSLAFSDTPLSQIEVKFTSLAGTGVTNASIVCANGGPLTALSENGAADPAFDDTDEVFTNLKPGTYTCTVVVDP
jgi:hypothetical protein